MLQRKGESAMPSILVVDDDPGVLEIISAQLADSDMESETARNGRIALQKLCARTAEDKAFDLVVLDLVMPEIDGWKVLKAIKTNPLWEHMKVIVISGYADSPSDLLRIIEFDGVYVEKRAGFVETVTEIVRRVLED